MESAHFKTRYLMEPIEPLQSRRDSARPRSKLPSVTSTKRLRRRATCLCHLQHGCKPWHETPGTAGTPGGCRRYCRVL